MINNKRIAKNAMFLYLRMLVIMLITLYTSRQMLKILGVENYGIYNIVGGVVVFSSFISTAMSSASQRFISYSIGEKSGYNTLVIFSTSLRLHYALGFVAILLLESIGYWFVITQLHIPSERFIAALWTFHISVAIMFFTFIRSPYLSAIISFERMDIIAILSGIESVLKFIVILILPFIKYDDLIIYSLLLLMVTLLTNVGYYLIAKYKLNIFFVKCYHKELTRKMLSFSWWSFMGGIGNIARGQGINMLFNTFFGVVVNAAMGIANQVGNAVNMFMTNFTMAFNPQIVQLYAERKMDEFHYLSIRASKFSFLLMSFMVLPLITCMDKVLTFWLGEYPEYTSSFSVCVVLSILVDAMSAPLWIAVGAVGKVRTYQILMFILSVIVLPACWILLLLGFTPATCMICNIVVNFLMMVVRIVLLGKYTGFPQLYYFIHIVIKGTVVFLLILGILIYFESCINLSSLVDVVVVTLASCVLSVILFGSLYLNMHERSMIKQMICKFIIRFAHK